MTYTPSALAKLSGTTTRTLHHYDHLGLLKPARTTHAGYRIYEQEQVNTLQQILLYKALGFSLEAIGQLLSAPNFDHEQAFTEHLQQLHAKRNQLDTLIRTVTQSIANLKGETTMTDHEKFEGLKQRLIDDNETTYGKEIREAYGDQTIDQSNAHLKGLTQEQYDTGERLRIELETALKTALATGDPASEAAQHACDLHRQWLCVYAPAHYNKAYHQSLGDMYVADERFSAYYDRIEAGCAAFLRDAINIYTA